MKIITNCLFSLLLASLSIHQGLCQSSDADELVPIRTGYYILASQNDFDIFMSMLDNGNTFAGDTIQLKTDVKGDNILNKKRIFYGTFLGNNHKISNLSKSFCYDLRGSIEKLTIDETCHISGSADVAPFCIYNYGILKECTNYAQVIGSANGSSYMHVGGICSISYGTIVYCINRGNVSATLNGSEKTVVRCGGITSFQQGENLVACENYGTINATAYYYILCGGINADQQGGILTGCINHGTVSSTVTGASSSGGATSDEVIHCTGGIVGQAQVGALINRCKNYGSISNNTQYVGGIAGHVGDTDLYNLANYGRVESVQGKFYSCAAGITGYTHAFNTARQIYNCINKGDIVSCSQYSIATAAGICPDIVNCNIANLYSYGTVSAQRVGGTGTQAFTISNYEFDSQSVELNKPENIEQANSFVESDNSSKERLLNWQQEGSNYSFVDYFYAYEEPAHGCVDFTVFFDNVNTSYSVKLIDEEKIHQIIVFGASPLRVANLQPSTSYSYEIYGETDGSYDKGTFTTLTPKISLTSTAVGYDELEFTQSCEVKGVNNIKAEISLYDEKQKITTKETLDKNIKIENLDEDANYSAEIIYTINGKEFKSKKVNVSTNPIIPQFSLVSSTPYSLTVKCDNYEELRKYSPCLYVKAPRYYEFGGYKEGNDVVLQPDEEGIVTIDNLLYGYAPKLSGKYTIHENERFRDADTFATLNWGGEGIIQLSPKAAMVHGLFGGMGTRVPNGGYNDLYDRARFYYKDATSSNATSESYVESACIDNHLDYASTIPMDNSFLYQYYLSLQRSQYVNPKNRAKDGEWQIIDSRNATVDIVEPRFYNMRFVDDTFYCSCIEGEETISSKILQYKVEEMPSYNELVLSKKSGTEGLSKKLTSIVPQLSYLLRMTCATKDGKKYYSPLYRLYNGILELATDVNEDPTSIENIDDCNIQVYSYDKQIIIKGKNVNDTVKVYNVLGESIYSGQESRIQVPVKGIYFVVMNKHTYKLAL